MSDEESKRMEEADKVSEEATRAVVAHILAQPTYSSREVGALLGDPDDLEARVRGLRRDRKLLGIWNGTEFRHPAFQFKEDKLMPEMHDLLAEIPLSDEDRRDGWECAYWMYFPNELLDDRCPADLFPSDPHRVIEAAHEEFADSDSDW